MADIANLIERLAAKHSLLLIDLCRNGEFADGQRWSCFAQWRTSATDGYNQRGIITAYGADPLAAVLNAASEIAIAQAGKWPVGLAEQVAA